MIKKNKNAGLWIRLLSITIDVFLFCSLAMSLSLICLQTKYFEQLDKSIYVVKNDYWYYLWLFFLILMLLIFFVVIPIFTKGKTIGMLLTKLDLKIQDKSVYKVILKRNQFSTFLWIVLIILFMIFVSPKIVNKIVVSSYVNKNYKNSSWKKRPCLCIKKATGGFFHSWPRSYSVTGASLPSSSKVTGTISFRVFWAMSSMRILEG